MHERLIDALKNNRHDSAPRSPDCCKRKRGLEVDFLLGGIHLTGFIEYHANEDRVTFTLKQPPASALDESRFRC